MRWKRRGDRGGDMVIREPVGSRWWRFARQGVAWAAVAAGVLAVTPLGAGSRGPAASAAVAAVTLLVLVYEMAWPCEIGMRISSATVRVWSGARRGEAIRMASIVSMSNMRLSAPTAGVPRVSAAGPHDLLFDSNACQAVRIEYRRRNQPLQTLIFVTASADAIFDKLHRAGVPRATGESSLSA